MAAPLLGSPLAPPALVSRLWRATPLGASDMLLELDLSRGLVESAPSSPVQALRTRRTPTLRSVVEALEKAAEDPHVRGLVMHLGTWAPSLAQSCELRAAVLALRESGRHTVAWSESYGESGPGNTVYHLATACREVWLQPSGDLGLTGPTARAVFFREALDKLGVEPQLAKRQEYKSAAETFTDERMSEPNREMLTAIVESVATTLVEDIASARDLEPARVWAAMDEAPLNAERAREVGLVDRLGYRDEVYAAARATAARPGAADDLELRFVTHHRAGGGLSRTLEDLGGRVSGGRPVVAVVSATGGIHLGRSGSTPLGGPSVGSDTLGWALRAAGRDASVKAVVLRIESPGGSYVASDTLRREVHALREGGTTVVASMGGVAGSGGYYLAMPCEAVVATPGTLTGSIGVLAGKQVLRGAMERAGVRRESVSVGRYADMFSPDRPFDEDEWRRLERWLDEVYDDFTTKAATDRSMPLEELRQVARGRVWTGADAARIGLVDELGGLSHAVGVACRLAGLDRADVAVRAFPRVSPLQRLASPVNSESPAAAYAAPQLGPVDLAEAALGVLLRAAGLPAYGVLSMPADIRLC